MSTTDTAVESKRHAFDYIDEEGMALESPASVLFSHAYAIPNYGTVPNHASAPDYATEATNDVSLQFESTTTTVSAYVVTRSDTSI